MYLSVCKYYGVEKRNILSQHDFRRDIVLAWVNPKEYKEEDIGKKQPTSVSSVTLDMSSVDTGPEIKKRCICDTAVTENSDLLKLCLDRSQDHLPEPALQRGRCGLH